MIRLSDEHWERIRDHFSEEHIPDGRPGRKPVPTPRVLEAVLWILNMARNGTCCRTLCVNGKGGRNVPHTESCRRQLPHRTKLRGALDQRRVLAEIAGTD
jgi:transposase